MRLWSLHPKYLDRQGLLAVWREGLLAQAVLKGATRGYTQHPQLHRFRQHSDSFAAIDAYLYGVYLEACERGYSFAREKIVSREPIADLITVTSGQLAFEREHLYKKLSTRDPERALLLPLESQVNPHPLFLVALGDVEPWEKSSSDS